MTRDEIIDLLWQHRPELLFITKEQFVSSLDGWDFDPREVDGKLAFIWMSKGPELHFAAMGARLPMSKGMLRAVLQPIIDRHGHVMVKTPKHDERQQRFNRTIGFREVGEDHYDIHFRMDRFGGDRSASCQ